MNPDHAAASARIREHANKDWAERNDPDHKIGGLPALEIFNPPIARPNPKRQAQHGS
jgi:hypothetical protein